MREMIKELNKAQGSIESSTLGMVRIHVKKLSNVWHITSTFNSNCGLIMCEVNQNNKEPLVPT